MSVQTISFAPAASASAHVSRPALESVLTNPASLPAGLVAPLLQLDGGVVDARFEGLPIRVFAHDVFVDELLWRIDAEGRYTLRRYNTLKLPDVDTTHAQLTDFLTDRYGSMARYADLRPEVLREPATATPLVNAPSGGIQIETGRSQWIQNTTRPDPFRAKTFAFALTHHPDLFGRYYVFVSPAQRTVRQVFQCT